MNVKVWMVVFAAVLFLGNIAHASEYLNVSLEEDDIYANEGLEVRTTYILPNDTEVYEVKLYFYIDGVLREVKNFQAISGTYNIHHIDTRYLDRGEHKLKVRIKVYADSVLESEEEVEFEIHEYNYPYWTNNIEVHSVDYSYPDANVVFELGGELNIDEGENGVLKLKFESNNDELHKVLIKYYVDGNYKGSSYKFFRDGDEKTFLLDLDDVSKGIYTLKVDAYIYKDSEFIKKVSKFVDLKVNEKSEGFVVYYLEGESTASSYSGYYSGYLNNQYSVSIYVDKDNLKEGEPVGVYGYTKKNGVLYPGSVKVYVNGRYVKEVNSDNSGYYNTYLYLEKPGYNIIEVYYNGINRAKKVYVEGEKKEVDRETVSQIGGNVALIVVKDGKVERLYIKDGNVVSSNEVDKEDVNYEYVDVSVSTKQLTMNQHRGNVLEIYVFNHMNESKVFSIDTDLDSKWTYLSESKIIKRGERGEFNIYFKPLSDVRGKIEANVYVKMNGETIKEIPIELFVAGPMTEKDYKKEGNDYLWVYWVIGAVLLIFVVLFVIYYVYHRKEEENEEERDGITLLNGDFVRVPENRLIR